MQLLTASKLSTVAMLAMAAVLVQSPVSGVPMEKSGVRGVPAALTKAELKVYKSTNGQPSSKSYQHLIAILAIASDPAEQKPLGQPPAHQEPHDASSVIPAHTGSLDPNAFRRQLRQNARIFVDKLDKAWNEFRKTIATQELTECQYDQIMAATSAWENVLKEINGQRSLKDCPYDQLPYTPDERPRGSSLREDQVSDLVKKSKSSLSPHVTHNICRLAVNGAYPWLLRMLASCYDDARNVILTVLGQLRLFTTDEVEAIKLDNFLKLFAFINQAENWESDVPSTFTPLLMAAIPETIPVLSYSPSDIVEAIFLRATNRRQSKSRTPLLAGGRPLADIIKTGSVNAFLNNLKPISEDLEDLPVYSTGLLDQFFEFDGSLDKTKSQSTNDVLDDPSIGFESDGKTIMRKPLLSSTVSRIILFEALANVLDLPRFIHLYHRIPQRRRYLSLIVMTGRSRKGPDAMFHVIEDILGEQGMPIKDGVQVYGQPLNTEHLVQLVQGCAMVCTEDNWKLFVDELLDKLRVTEQLPGYNDTSDSAQSSLADQIAGKITLLIKRLNQRLADSRYTEPVKQKVEKAVQEVEARMNEAINQLNTIHDLKSNVKVALRE